jgi:flagellar hook-associated protein 3 FlgL
MRPVGPSFLSLQLLPQDSIRRNQQSLSEAQHELSTQRRHDVSLYLGRETGRNIGWHAELSALEGNIRTADLAGVQTKTTEVGLATLGKVAADFLNNLISSRSAEKGQDIIRNQAQSAISMLRDAINVDVGGIFPFAGRNQNVAPLPAYEGGAGQAQVVAAFSSAFGFPPGDPAMATLTGTQVTAFLDGGFAALFASPNWNGAFSTASVENVKLRVGHEEQLDLMPNANTQAIRDLYAALVSVSELATGELSDDTFKALVDKAAQKTSSAVQGLGDMQARLGIGQKALADATEQLKLRKTSLTDAIHMSESVDTYEVASRINGLMTQLEASYSVTSRISRISLLNYL